MPRSLIIQNIGWLLVVPPGPVRGGAMHRVGSIPDAVVAVEGERIAWFGPREQCSVPGGAIVLDAAGGCVTPGLVDCHTHAVFSGSRAQEFEQRIAGKSYAQIAAEGGGIRTTVEAVRQAGEEQLVALARPRLARMLRHGVTTVEIKSGYGLSVPDELKMLRAVRRLAAEQPVELIGTYLAAHTTPRELAGRGDDYLDTVFADEVLAVLRDEKLAEFCDVFCEQTAFDVTQCRRILNKAKGFGLVPKVHADQLSAMGASRLAAEVGAISADHLEHIDDAGTAALGAAGTIPVLLPACSFFLGVSQAPARRLLDADLPVAVATDCNPGSSMVESLPLTLSIACTQMRMTPTEALVAATANAAAAVGRQGRVGAMAVGHQADLVILDVPDHRQWLYEVGRNCVRQVIKKGRVVVEA